MTNPTYAVGITFEPSPREGWFEIVKSGVPRKELDLPLPPAQEGWGTNWSMYISTDIAHGSLEGPVADMVSIAHAILDRGWFAAKRCAVDARPERESVLFWRPKGGLDSSPGSVPRFIAEAAARKFLRRHPVEPPSTYPQHEEPYYPDSETIYHDWSDGGVYGNHHPDVLLHRSAPDLIAGQIRQKALPDPADNSAEADWVRSCESREAEHKTDRMRALLCPGGYRAEVRPANTWAPPGLHRPFIRFEFLRGEGEQPLWTVTAQVFPPMDYPGGAALQENIRRWEGFKCTAHAFDFADAVTDFLIPPSGLPLSDTYSTF